MPFYRYFTKNNAQGTVINDTSSQITFQAGHTLPTNVTSGEFLLTLGGPGGEIVKVTNASQDGSGILTIDVTRAQENSSYLDATSGTVGYLYLTAGMFNKAYDILEEHETKLNYMTITQAVNLDTLESDTAANNAKVTNAAHTGDVTGSGVLGIVPAAISGRTGVTPVSGDYLLLWDATDSALKKADASNFVNLVTSVNGLTGAVTLVTGNISDTTSTQKYATAAQLAKIDYLTITQAVDLDTLESDTATNNAKVTNAAHTGDVTGSGVLGIVPAAISGRTGVTPVSGDYLLLWDATDSTLKKADASNFLAGAVSSVNTFTGAVTLVTGNISDTTSTQKYTTSANLTKIGFISVTQAVDLDTMESDIATNNAKVTNANHTGDVTGSAALVIVPSAISGKTGVTPVSGDYLLLWDATDSTLKKVDASNFLGGGGGTGDVTGPASSTDSGIAIFNGTGGKTIKNSLVTIDTTSVTIPGFLSITGQARNTAQTALSTSGIVTWNLNNDPKANIILAGDVTSFTFSGINLNTEGTLYIKQNASTAYDIDWPLSLVWANGSTPDISELDSKHIVSFYSYDGTGLIGAHISSTFYSGGGGAVDSVNTFTGAVTLVTGNISDTTSTQKYTTAANLTKIGYISVTQAVDLDTIESDTATNNAKVTNANHTGDVTGSGVLGIVPAAISGRTGVTPVSGDYLLLWDATDSTLKKVDASNFLGGGGGTGDVTGPASSTNTGIAIFNGTGGKTLMNSLVTIDTTSVTIPGFLTITGQTRQSTQTSLTTTGSFTWNINNNPAAQINALTGDVTLTISGIAINANAILYVKQHASAAKTITWPGTVVWSGGYAPDLSTVGSDHFISFYSYDGTNLIGSHSTTQNMSTLQSTSGSTVTGAIAIWDGTSGTTVKDTTSMVDVSGNFTNVLSINSTVWSTFVSDMVANTAKVTNAAHTGDVTGSGVLGIVPAAISGRTGVTPVSGDYVLLWDATDSALKKADVSTFLGGGGGDVTGPVSSTPYNIALFSDDSGKLLEASIVSIDPSGHLTGATTINADYSITIGSNVTSSNSYLNITADVPYNKNIRFTSDTLYVWAIGSYNDTHFKIERFDEIGESLDYPFIIDSTTGNITTTGTINSRNISTDGTKLDLIDVTGSVNLDTLKSDTTTNNAKVTNATHTGDVTGSGVLGIVPAAISGRTGVTPVAGDYVLLWDATDSALKKADVTAFISAGGGGDVTGPASSTNTGVAIFNGTGGKTLMNSLVTIDTSSVTVPGFLTITGQARHVNQTALSTSGAVTWNLNNDPKAKIILSGDVTGITLSGINLNTEATLYIKQHASSAKVITWPAGIIWAGNTEPVISTLNSNHVITFYSYDGTGLFGAHISDMTSSFTSNVTHTGDVTGADVLGIVPAAISGRTSVTAVSGDYVLLWDATDSLLKKANVSDFISAVTASSTTTFTNKRNTKRVATIADGTGLDINSDNYDSGYVVLAGNRTLNYFTGTPTNHQTLMIEFIQDATGSRTVTLKDTTGVGSFRVGSDVTGLVLSTVAGKNDLALFTYSTDSTAWLLTSVTKGY